MENSGFKFKIGQLVLTVTDGTIKEYYIQSLEAHYGNIIYHLSIYHPSKKPKNKVLTRREDRIFSSLTDCLESLKNKAMSVQTQQALIQLNK